MGSVDIHGITDFVLVIALGLCLLVLPIGGWSQTNNEAGNESSERFKDEDICTAASPNPILLPGAYPEHMFERGQNNEATESALLDDGTGLEISYTGCVDALAQTFIFLVRPVSGDTGDVHYWANFAREKLLKLRVDEEKAWFLASLARFLSQVHRYRPQGNRISICKDGSAPDIDGCGFETGGGYFFEVERGDTILRVVAGQYDSL